MPTREQVSVTGSWRTKHLPCPILGSWNNTGLSPGSLHSHQLTRGAGCVLEVVPGSTCLTPHPWPCLPFSPGFPLTQYWEVALTVGDTSPACVAQSLALQLLDASTASVGLLVPASSLHVPRGFPSPNSSILTLLPHLARTTHLSGTYPGRAGNKTGFLTVV